VVATGSPAALKAAHGGDVLELLSAEPSVAARAAKLLVHRSGLAEKAIHPDTDPGCVRLTVPSGSHPVPEVVRILDTEGLCLDDIRVRRASLDEVFTALITAADVR